MSKPDVSRQPTAEMSDEPKKPSQAPKPITPLRGTGGGVLCRKPARAPDWKFWLSMPKVRLWQAAYLTCGTEPDDFVYRDICNSGISDEKVAKRLRVLEAHFGHINSEIQLSDVSNLGLSFDWNMPPELVAIVRQANKQAGAPAMPTGKGKVPGSGQTTTTHTLKTMRGNVLNPVIELARKKALPPANTQSVWAALQRLAESVDRPAPLLGFAEAEGVKYQDHGGVKFLSKRNLSDRMRRAKAR